MHTGKNQGSIKLKAFWFSFQHQILILIFFPKNFSEDFTNLPQKKFWYKRGEILPFFPATFEFLPLFFLYLVESLTNQNVLIVLAIF